ncbi:phosphatase YqaB [Enterobacter hormaechei]|nr:phosphatase YqaB [Enterobacter hormaechei]
MYAQYDGLIFDMDGTLLDTEPTHRQAWTEVLGRYGMRFDFTGDDCPQRIAHLAYRTGRD